MVLYRLFRDADPQQYCLISENKWISSDSGSHQPNQLPGKYYQLPLQRYLSCHGSNRFRQSVAIPLAVLSRAKQIADIVSYEKCDAVVACTGDLLDLPAGYLASCRTGVPFFAYIFDHYSYREWYNSVRQFWAKRFEPVLMRKAAGVIAPNEVLRDDLRQNFGINAAVIHNSLDISTYQTLMDNAPVKSDTEVRIVYTGNIYEAHYDAFRNLLDAIKRLEGTNIKLHLYTTRTPDELANVNIQGPIVCHPHRTPVEIPSIQRQANFLFLPLAFNSPYPDLVRTSATTKLGEYLAARRPVIAHAPPDSFVAWYFREHRCGLVVDRDDSVLLAQTIEQALNDEGLSREIEARAWVRAQTDFSVTTAQTKFTELVECVSRST